MQARECLAVLFSELSVKMWFVMLTSCCSVHFSILNDDEITIYTCITSLVD